MRHTFYGQNESHTRRSFIWPRLLSNLNGCGRRGDIQNSNNEITHGNEHHPAQPRLAIWQLAITLPYLITTLVSHAAMSRLHLECAAFATLFATRLPTEFPASNGIVSLRSNCTMNLVTITGVEPQVSPRTQSTKTQSSVGRAQRTVDASKET